MKEHIIVTAPNELTWDELDQQAWNKLSMTPHLYPYFKRTTQSPAEAWHTTQSPVILVGLIARLLRGRRQDPHSVLFGERIVDGALFPLLALGLALAVRRHMASIGPGAAPRAGADFDDGLGDE